METIIIVVFVLGYLAITLEHSIKVDKLVPALVMMAISWALISLGIDSFPNWFDSAKHALVDNFPGLAHEAKMELMEEVTKTPFFFDFEKCVTISFFNIKF